MGAVVLMLGLSVATAQETQRKPVTPTEQYQALLKEFQEAVNTCNFKAETDEERIEPQARFVRLSPRVLALAEENPKGPVALDALLQAVVQELWLQGNTEYPGRGKGNLEGRAIAILLRDHVRNDGPGEACRRISYGFSKERESILRVVLHKNPHKDIRGLACRRLAQFLNGRVQTFDLLGVRPDMAWRYEGLFGKAYLAVPGPGQGRQGSRSRSSSGPPDNTAT